LDAKLPCNPLFYRQAQFLSGAVTLAQTPADEGWEVAFAGRSNAGKSSAINSLCDQRDLARTSKIPGRTQQLNFFLLDPQRRLVDLPGYGYAAVAEAVKRRWQGLLADYLGQRRSLRGVILVTDIRQALTDYDRQMLDWSRARGLPTHLLLSKADKLNRGPATQILLRIRQELSALDVPPSLQLFSALKRDGIPEAQAVLDRWLEVPTDNP
jgi:GTP-binding protein